ncbi:hypothetical protein D1B31_04935 [Neobacillus notoginsengisoli]|uniref:Uncharacterized protein n=1 Tax=Neobacillus notoginsengisoli TaxID=1578198 RepID=A0A417YX34_9BACI|nr:hypothetical protein D1B31_04935 [Neobacillus notoginsengisoli]
MYFMNGCFIGGMNERPVIEGAIPLSQISLKKISETTNEIRKPLKGVRNEALEPSPCFFRVSNEAVEPSPASPNSGYFFWKIKLW